uniref:Uncharacterized protein n=1 Tax=Bionectria ochroleuca TaxID=29856 RepID=A0A0B7KMC9_BIOOC
MYLWSTLNPPHFAGTLAPPTSPTPAFSPNHHEAQTKAPETLFSTIPAGLDKPLQTVSVRLTTHTQPPSATPYPGHLLAVHRKLTPHHQLFICLDRLGSQAPARNSSRLGAGQQAYSLSAPIPTQPTTTTPTEPCDDSKLTPPTSHSQSSLPLCHNTSRDQVDGHERRSFSFPLTAHYVQVYDISAIHLPAKHKVISAVAFTQIRTHPLVPPDNT